ncbi:hypothetical protein AGABI2DRAFT_116534 [Agaricus bisporus var. bisporus H97]|uniref:hypothetical protein n=1 Tax=Agaricus bisporus var. bisporus (strain H97 / ATCC MYA-4626 / FGSC 10389) TaxID=936046 RepID=UPI00029F716A|nr:hypothetical protein AGABI2DRAFT_116534 [Agaricus bisporus var. bisporus H97]EKV49498.1 hypothetical protein AGABI2DRAFT_116534 [Agaricus bisporus var. bisporus H97]
MARKQIVKLEGSETKESKPQLNTSASSGWIFPPSSQVSSAGSYAQPSFFPTFPPGLTPANGHAPPPRSNQDIFYPTPLSLPTLHQSPPAPHPLINNQLPPNYGVHAAPISYPSMSVPAALVPDPSTSQIPLLPAAVSDDESSVLPPVEELLSKVAVPAPKKAGARRSTKAKGKAKALDEYPTATRGTKRKSMDDTAEEVEAKRPRSDPAEEVKPEVKPKRRGRVKNSPNYFKKDLDLLLEITREVLPIGARGWEEVGKRFNEMAAKMGRPTRPAKSLELKVKNLAKTTKPTGSATVPEHVQEALIIDDLINAKAGTLDLDDDDIIDIDSDESGDDDDDDTPGPSQAKSKVQYVARHIKTPKPPSSQIRNGNHTFLTNIGLALDPSTRHARHENLQVQILQTQQISSLTQQLRDAQKRIDSLCAQLIETERRYQDAARRADRAEMQSFISTTQNNTSSQAPQPLPPPIHNPPIPSAPRRELYRQDVIFPDGQQTLWIGGSDDEHDYITGVNDSPGTRRFTYPDPRSYQSSSTASPSAPTSSHRASSFTHHSSFSHRAQSSPYVSRTAPGTDEAVVDDAGSEVSQPL